MSELVDKLLKMKEEYNNQVKEMGQKIIKELLKEFFDKNPKILGVEWTQYTPYFNDGEACEFSVNGIENVLINKQDTLLLSDPTNEDDREEDETNPDNIWVYECFLNNEIRTAVGKLDKDLQTLEDCLLHVFGDHAKVTARRSEITYNEFDHD